MSTVSTIPAALQNITFPVRFEAQSSHGRRLLASHDVKGGDLVLTCPAAVSVVADIMLDSICHQCMKKPQDAALFVCSGCMFARFCSVSCMNNAKTMHMFECQALKAWNDEMKAQEDLNSSLSSYGTSVRLVLRILALKKVEEHEQMLRERLRAKAKRSSTKSSQSVKASRYDEVLDLVSNAELANQEELRELEQFVTDLKEVFGPDLWPSNDGVKEVLRLFLRIQCNAHTITSSTSDKSVIALGLFPSACYLNHSCVPNCVYTTAIDDKGIPTIEFRAVRNLSSGEEVCYSYVDMYQPVALRQNQLEKAYLFQCDCSRCSDDFSEAPLEQIICPGCKKERLDGNCVECGRKVDVPALLNHVNTILSLSGSEYAVILRNLQELRFSHDFQWLCRTHHLKLNVNLATVHCASAEGDWKLVHDASAESLTTLEEFAERVGSDALSFPEIGFLHLSLGRSLLETDGDKEVALEHLQKAHSSLSNSLGGSAEQVKQTSVLIQSLKPKAAPRSKKNNKKGKR